MKSWPSVYIGSSGVMPAVSPKSYSKRPSVSVGHDDGSTATSRTSASSTNGSASPPRFEPPPHGRDHDVGPRLAGQGQLLLGLEPDDRLVQQHVVEHRAERVVRVVAAGGVAHRVGDGQRRASRATSGSSTGDGTHSAPHVSIITRRYGFWSYDAPDHVHLALEVELRAGEGERRAPLAGAGLGGEPRDALRLVVEGLRHRGVGLVRAGRADTDSSL